MSESVAVIDKPKSVASTVHYLLWDGRVLDFAKTKQGTLNKGPGAGTEAPVPTAVSHVNLVKGKPVVTPSPGISVRIVSTTGFVYAGAPSRIAIQIRLKGAASMNRLLLRVYKQFSAENKACATERLVYQEVLDHGQILALPDAPEALPQEGGYALDAGGWPSSEALPYRVVVWASATKTAFDVSTDRLSDPDTHYNDPKYRGRTIHDQSGAAWAKTKVNDQLLKQTKYKLGGLLKSEKRRVVDEDKIGINLIRPSSFGIDAFQRQDIVGGIETPPVKIAPTAQILGVPFWSGFGSGKFVIRPLHPDEPGTSIRVSPSDGNIAIFAAAEKSEASRIRAARLFPRAEIPPEGITIWFAGNGDGGPTVRSSFVSIELVGAPSSPQAVLPITIFRKPKELSAFFSPAPRNLSLAKVVAEGRFDIKDDDVDPKKKTGFHGTASTLLGAWSPNKFSLLSLKELSVRGIAQTTGEGDSNSGESGLKDQISIGVDSEGFGIAAAYAWATGVLPTYNVALFSNAELAEEHRVAKLIDDASKAGISLRSVKFDMDRFLQEAQVQSFAYNCDFNQVVGHLQHHKALSNTGGYAKRLKDEIDKRALGGAAPPPFGIIFEFALNAQKSWKREGTIKGEATILTEIPLHKYIRRVYAPRGQLASVLTQVKAFAPARMKITGIPFEAIEHLPADATARVVFTKTVKDLIKMSAAMRACLRAIEQALTQGLPAVEEALPRPISLPDSNAVGTVRGTRVAMSAVQTEYKPTATRTVDELFASIDLAQTSIDRDGKTDDDLNIFLAPEWYFRKHGAVPFTHREMRKIVEDIKTKSLNPKYANWLIVPGTVYFGMGYDGVDFATPLAVAAKTDIETYFTLKKQLAADDSPLRDEPGAPTHFLIGNVGVVVYQGKLVNYRFKIFEHDIHDDAKASKREQWAYERMPLMDAINQSGPALFGVTHKGKSFSFAHEICREHMMQTAALKFARRHKVKDPPVPKKPGVDGVDIHLLVCNDVGLQAPSIVARDAGFFLHCEGKGDDTNNVYAIKRAAPPSITPKMYTDRFAKEATLQRLTGQYGDLCDAKVHLQNEDKTASPTRKTEIAEALKKNQTDTDELLKTLLPAREEVEQVKKSINDAGGAKSVGTGSLANVRIVDNKTWLWTGKIFPDEG
jgi:hypothetical protein